MPAKATLFLNRNSGAKMAAGEIDALRETAAAQGVDIVEISPDVDCAREIPSRGTSVFIAAGGDGTVHHVLQALIHAEAALAVLPLGTYNHFAKDLGIPLDWREAFDVALNGDTRQVDTGRINDRFFVNNVSIGLYPELVAKREERGRDYPRWKARFVAFYATVRKYPHVTITVETEHRHEAIRTHVFMVSNNQYDLERVGVEAPRERLTDGNLSVYWLGHTSRLRMMRFIARYAAGRVRTIPEFHSFRTTSMRVRTARPRIKVGIDGELFSLDTPLVVTAVPRSLSVRVPRKDASG